MSSFGLTMAGFIAVPLKKTSEVELVKPLKNLIASTYSTADNPEDYSEALNELNKLRMNATWRTLDKHESSLDIMYRYYDQLTALEAKVPPSDIQIAFKWKDAFDKGSFFGGRMGLTVSSMAYEKVCILFNVAAMQSQIAASQNTETDEGLKLMAKLFQQASGIFNHLKNIVMSSIQQEPTPDLSPETLSALSSLMIAQAQESFFFKATNDRMKDAIIAKITAQVEDCFADALKQMQKENLKTLWEKDWIGVVAGKQAAYHGIAEYYQSQVAKSQKSVGEELSRLQHSIDLLRAAESRSSTIGLYKEWIGKAQRAFDETKKDNDFIYHEVVPDVKTLTPIGKAALAKPIPLGERLSTNFKDMFDALVPVPIHQALAAYDVRKTAIVNGEIAKLRENTQTMNGVLASLNLPAALEDTSGDTLPQSLKDKARTIRDKGGLVAIEKLIQELPDLLQRNKEILDEAERMLNDEQESDVQLRSQFKDSWTRVTSEKLTEPMRLNATKYRTIINNAMQADTFVRDKFSGHRHHITLLSKPEHELEAAVPSANPSKALKSSSTVSQLRGMMETVETIKAERDAVEAELKNVSFDLKSIFLNMLAKDGSINEPAVSVEKLGELYGGLQKRVRNSVDKQIKLMAEIETVNMDFCKEKSTNQSSATRDGTLRDLASAYDAYMELSGNLHEGTKFYNDLTHLLVTFQNKVNDFCFARKTEKEELMRDLQQSIANSSGTAPTPPPHATVSADPRKPPPRPPPPIPAHGSSQPSSAPPPPISIPQQQQIQPTAAAASNYPSGPPPPQQQLPPYPMNPQPMPMPMPPQQYAYPSYQYMQPPMPTGYNPYGGYIQQPPVGYTYPRQDQNYPPNQQTQPPYPAYPTYPQQHW
uniref:BRO1 domain-containing protein n=1 Tax=Strigamia maritima TaxID=126957 RepID=T1JEE2_STRMM